MTREQANTTGFKNIQEYLQEAALYSAKKDDNLTSETDERTTAVNGGTSMSMQGSKRTKTQSVVTNKLPPYLHSNGNSVGARKGASVVGKQNNSTLKAQHRRQISGQNPGKTWNPSYARK